MRSFITYWHIDGLMAVFLILISIGYYYLTGFKPGGRTKYFIIGYGLIILSVASPLHFLGENYLMSAHMLSHVIILLVAAPLLVIGIPPDSQNKLFTRLSEILTRHVWLPWMVGVCIMWFWHIPIIFNHLFETPGLSGLESGLLTVNVLRNVHWMSLVVAGILFSWPLIGPGTTSRIAPLNAVLYLSAACVFCSILGLMITFAPAGIYTRYMHINDRFGFLNMIRNDNGISVLVDQQIAGLIMWVPGCLIYLTASMYLLMQWFKEKKEETVLHTNNMKS